jgi:hypothetical protein
MRRTVTRFESNLLRILQGLLTQADQNRVIRLLERTDRWPESLHRDSVELIQDFLAKGTVMWLVRAGAWKQQRHLRGEEATRGSLWQRTPPQELGLRFSAASIDFLIWLTTTNVLDSRYVWSPGTKHARQSGRKSKAAAKLKTLDSAEIPGWSDRPMELATGDEFLLFLAARFLRGTPVLEHWLASELMMRHPLIALVMPDQFARVGVMPKVSFDAWMSGGRSLIIEALQAELAHAWIVMEKGKAEVRSMSEMVRLGEVQQAVLSSMMKACEQHERRDLCRFVLEAMTAVATPSRSRKDWIGALETKGKRLAERTAVYEHASAFLRSHVPLQQWQRASAGVSFFDEGYAASQLWKNTWEECGAEESVAEAKRIVADLQ